MRPIRRLPVAAVVAAAAAAAVLSPVSARTSSAATVVAQFREEFAGPTPAAGWSYAWNVDGALNASAPEALSYDAVSGAYEAGGADPSGADLFVGPASVFPGFAAGQGGNAVERYAIVSYTITADDVAAAGGPGRYEASLTEYSFRLADGTDSDGVNAAFFLNDTNLTQLAYGLPVLPLGPDDSFSEAQYGAFPLGEVGEGDRITFAIGASGPDAIFAGVVADNVGDEVELDFTISLSPVPVPEPGGLGVLAVGGAAMLARRSRRGRRGPGANG